MKVTQNIKSKTKPAIVEDNGHNVLVRKDIKSEEVIDPVFNTKETIYTYTEEEYNYNEWNKKTTDDLKNKNELIQQQIDITQLALVEVLSIAMSSSFEVMSSYVRTLDDNDNEPLIGLRHNSIVSLYNNMVSKGLIELSDVPEVYKSEVEKEEE